MTRVRIDRSVVTRRRFGGVLAGALVDVVIAVALGMSLACNGATDPHPARLRGTYTLRTINGKPLPVVVQGGQRTLTAVGGVLLLSEDGTWSETDTYQATFQNGPTTSQTDSAGGTWVQDHSSIVSNRSTVVFTSLMPGKASFVGTVTWTSIERIDGRFDYVFTK